MGALIALVPMGCKSFRDCRVYPRTRPDDARIAEFADYQAEIQRVRDRKDRRLVWIDARDIELPQTSSHDEPPDDREYTFYVWAFDPLNPDWDVETLLRNDRLQLNVVGVENARITPATLTEGSTLANYQPLNPVALAVTEAEEGRISEALAALDATNGARTAAEGAVRTYRSRLDAWTVGKGGVESKRLARDQAHQRKLEADEVLRAAQKAEADAARVVAQAPDAAARDAMATTGAALAAKTAAANVAFETARKGEQDAADAMVAAQQALAAQETEMQRALNVARSRVSEAARAVADVLERAEANAASRSARVLALDRATGSGGTKPMPAGVESLPVAQAALDQAKQRAERARVLADTVDGWAREVGAVGPTPRPERTGIEGMEIGRGRVALGKWVPNRSMRNVAMIKVRSNEITQSLTIGAAFPDLFHAFEDARRKRVDALAARLQQEIAGGRDERGAPRSIVSDISIALDEALAETDPYADIRRIRVFNGDLHTQVYMLSKEETIDAFGEMFERYFFVGRTYFRNRHPDKTLVVNTTSLRARCLFYREPDATAARHFLEDPAGGAATHRYEYFRRLPGFLAAETVGADGRAIRQGPAQYVGRSRTGIARGKVAALAKRAAEAALAPTAGAATPGASDAAVKQAIVDEVVGADADHVEVNGLSRVAPTPALAPAEKVRAEAAQIVATAWTKAKQLPASGRCSVTRDELERLVDEVVAQYVVPFGSVEFPMPVPVTPMEKSLASSPNVFRQGAMAGAGYLFQDYYRPMTFKAVLVSLLAKTEEDPHNEALRWLEGLGQVAGALVGAEGIAPFFGTKAWAQIAAVSSGVVVPELRKILLRDVQKYVKNLGMLGLDTVIKISPGEPVDGYVFFPKGPIFGFGVDEYGPATPTFIVNIDNDDVAVDGLLVDKSQEFSSGVMDGKSLVEEARNEGISLRGERERELVLMQARLSTYALNKLQAEVDDAVEQKQFGYAANLIAIYEKFHGSNDPTGTLGKVRAKAKLDPVGDVAALGGRALLLGTASPLEARSQLSLARTSDPAGSTAGPTDRGAVYRGTFEVMLSEPVSGAPQTILQVQAQIGKDLEKLATVSFRVRKRGSSEWGPAAALDFLAFANDAAAADASPRVQHWSKPYEIEVSVQSTAKADSALDGRTPEGDPLDAGLFLVLERVGFEGRASSQDRRHVRLVPTAK